MSLFEFTPFYSGSAHTSLLYKLLQPLVGLRIKGVIMIIPLWMTTPILIIHVNGLRRTRIIGFITRVGYS